MANYYCEYCGTKFQNVNSLTAANCFRHPHGGNRGKHKLYQGSEKDKYTCKHCGQSYRTLMSLTASNCFRHPLGGNKGKHAPAL